MSCLYNVRGESDKINIDLTGHDKKGQWNNIVRL